MTAIKFKRLFLFLKEKQLKVRHIESRESRKKVGDLEILVQLELSDGITSKSVADTFVQNGYDVTEPKPGLQHEQSYEEDDLIIPSFVRGELMSEISCSLYLELTNK